MDLQTIINSRLGVGLAFGLSTTLPPGPGLRVARFLADLIASQRRSAMVQAVRANQWVIRGEQLSPAELDQAVRQTFRHTAHCLYDLYHNLRDPQYMDRKIQLSDRVEEVIDRIQARQEGMVVVAPHLSNFDFVARAAARRGLRAMVLSFPQPGGGYRWQNEIRRETGLEIIPASTQVLRPALRFLQSGGSVLTGIDRPYPESKYRPQFFGRPAPLPVIHVYLALRAQVPVVVAAAKTQEDGHYLVEAAEPIPMKSYSDREQEILSNAEHLLEVAADFICPHPEQWAMYYPVWPDVLDGSPAGGSTGAPAGPV